MIQFEAISKKVIWWRITTMFEPRMENIPLAICCGCLIYNEVKVSVRSWSVLRKVHIRWRINNTIHRIQKTNQPRLEKLLSQNVFNLITNNWLNPNGVTKPASQRPCWTGEPTETWRSSSMILPKKSLFAILTNEKYYNSSQTSSSRLTSSNLMLVYPRVRTCSNTPDP